MVRRRGTRPLTVLESDRRHPRWQLAWFASIIAIPIAIAIAIAGMMKAHSGWLEVSVASSYGHTLANAVVTAHQTWLGGVMAAALQMDIHVTWNLIAYSVFVPWAAALRPGLPAIGRSRPLIVAGAVALLTVRATVAW